MELRDKNVDAIWFNGGIVWFMLMWYIPFRVVNETDCEDIKLCNNAKNGYET